MVGQLHAAYAASGYVTQFTSQTRSWAEVIPALQRQLADLSARKPESRDWTVILEFPLYRLRKRIDAVVLARATIVVMEFKAGAERFASADKRQVEEYALDLRDFHEGSRNRLLIPILIATDADQAPELITGEMPVWPVSSSDVSQLPEVLYKLPTNHNPPIVAEDWLRSPYRPVPTVIQAATTIFADAEIPEMLQAGATNLKDAATRIIELVVATRAARRHALIFLTGVPRSGKTLAGLRVVHDAIATGQEERGDIVYLSGNTPLVVVLREALARDRHERIAAAGDRQKLDDIRRDVKARIQHINDFLKQYLDDGKAFVPHEHAIVFDEAQRAWDEQQGAKKFSRSASEPSILLELMSRHDDWSACICLVGGGQEINTGEKGVRGWGEALCALPDHLAHRWTVYAPPDVIDGGPSTAGDTIGKLPSAIKVERESRLQLAVPLRSYRSPLLSDWVSAVLRGNAPESREISLRLGDYPIALTRSLEQSRAWLRQATRGERRCGLVASSGARRLRADGLGQLLGATDGAEIANWYLNPEGDIRSSHALEVPANEYACQGLELDFVGVCWGGNLLWDGKRGKWASRRLNGNRWQRVTDEARVRYNLNSYRVLMTRAREGMILWVPEGDSTDSTREPISLNDTAEYLVACGAQLM